MAAVIRTSRTTRNYILSSLQSRQYEHHTRTWNKVILCIGTH